MDDETYRAMLFTVAGVRSSKDMSLDQQQLVLAHLKDRGWKPRPPIRKQKRPVLSKDVQIKKIQALIINMQLNDPYVDAIAKRVAKVDVWQWADDEDLTKIIAALEYERKKRG